MHAVESQRGIRRQLDGDSGRWLANAQLQRNDEVVARSCLERDYALGARLLVETSSFPAPVKEIRYSDEPSEGIQTRISPGKTGVGDVMIDAFKVD